MCPPAPVCKLCDLNQSLLGGRGEQMCPSGLHPLTITSECQCGEGFVSTVLRDLRTECGEGFNFIPCFAEPHGVF